VTQTSIAHLPREKFVEVPIPVPTPVEQRAIAAALSDVDALLAKLDQLIAKKRDIKQAAMQQLLTGKKRLPGFSGEWETATLKQAAEISAGINKPISEMGSGALYVTVQDLYDGTSIQIQRLGRIKVSPLEVQAKVLVADDIVFGKSSVKREGIGFPSRFLGSREPVVFSGFTYRARARNGIADATFLFYALRWNKTRQWLIDNSQASALTNINQSIADAIPVPLPSIHEQTAIATILSDMDAEIAALEARRDKTRDLKQGMMQELLTGRIRLV
jgi:type I restriction enzyme S subunit